MTTALAAQREVEEELGELALLGVMGRKRLVSHGYTIGRAG